MKSSDFVRYNECAILTGMGEFDVRAIERAISRLRETQANAFGSEEHGFRMILFYPQQKLLLSNAITRFCFRPSTANS